jgi:hypothetical protein
MIQQTLAWQHWVHKIQTDEGLETWGTQDKKQILAWQHWVHKIKTDMGLTTLGTQDKNSHWPDNIGYTRYKQTLAWQHCVHKIETDTGLTPGPSLFLSYVPNVARPVSVFVLCTQCC